MATIEPGWYWARTLGQGWFGPFLTMGEMLTHAKIQGAKVVYSVGMCLDVNLKPYAAHVIDWTLNETTGEYEEKKAQPCR